jgi:hypothetical protein
MPARTGIRRLLRECRSIFLLSKAGEYERDDDEKCDTEKTLSILHRRSLIILVFVAI